MRTLPGTVRSLLVRQATRLLPLLLAAGAAQGGGAARPRAAAVIAPSGVYPEQSAVGMGGVLEMPETFRALVARVRRAGRDAGVKVVLLDLARSSWSLDAAKRGELRAELARLRKSGKKVAALLGSAETSAYLLAAGCDEIWMMSGSLLLVPGVKLTAVYLKDLLAWAGIEMDVVRVGRYKTAFEPFTRSEMSDETREVLEGMVEEFYQAVIKQVAEGRKLPVERVKRLIDTGHFTAAGAKEAGLVDRVVGTEAEIRRELARLAGGPVTPSADYGKPTSGLDFSNPFALLTKLFMPPARRRSDAPKIAVLYAEGAILDGDGKRDLFGSGVHRVPFTRIIRLLAKDERVKAVVLRVDSGGGSAAASAAIEAELRRLAAKKPLFASLGRVAASGGYYICAPAEKIFVSPQTITGSIGVVGAKLVTRGIRKKLKIRTYTLSRGEKAKMFSGEASFSPAERRALQRAMDATYESFLKAVARGRKMDLARVRTLARGRIYTGRQALKLGLADQAGGLAEALAAARRRVGLEEAEVEYYPERRHFLEALLSGGAFAPGGASGGAPWRTAARVAEMLGRLGATGPGRALGAPVLARGLRIAEMLRAPRILAVAPCLIHVRRTPAAAPLRRRMRIAMSPNGL